MGFIGCEDWKSLFNYFDGSSKMIPIACFSRVKEFCWKQSSNSVNDFLAKSSPMTRQMAKNKASMPVHPPMRVQIRSALGALFAFSAMRNKCF